MGNLTANNVLKENTLRCTRRMPFSEIPACKRRGASGECELRPGTTGSRERAPRFFVSSALILSPPHGVRGVASERPRMRRASLSGRYLEDSLGVRSHGSGQRGSSGATDRA